MSDTPRYAVLGGACAICGVELRAYESKCYHHDGRIACGGCIFHPTTAPADAAAWLHYSDG